MSGAHGVAFGDSVLVAVGGVGASCAVMGGFHSVSVSPAPALCAQWFALLGCRDGRFGGELLAEVGDLRDEQGERVVRRRVRCVGG